MSTNSARGPSDTSRVRILVVDDNEIVRMGLEVFLNFTANLEYVGFAESGQEAVSECARLLPDVVLMDLVMLDGNDGAAATKSILEATPFIRILALSAFLHQQLVEDAFEAGVTGYVLKNVSNDRLEEAIQDTFHGIRSISPEVRQVLLQVGKADLYSTAS